MVKQVDPRIEPFARALADGKDTIEAYLWAGYEATADAPEKARKLRVSKRVKERVAELIHNEVRREKVATKKAAEKLSLTKEYVLSRLIENVERAMQAVPVLDKKGNPTGEYKYEGAVANKALELLGRELGLFVERKEIGTPGEFATVQTADELRELIFQRLRLVEPGHAAPGVLTIEGSLREEPSGVH